MKPTDIPNLNLGQTYDKLSKDAYVHYESLDNFASFFGRAMQIHRHDRYYQLHFIHQGKVHLNLGEQEYSEEAPLFFFTPPAVPHGFITDANAKGQVLTIHQNLVEQFLQTLNQSNTQTNTMAACITLKKLPKEFQHDRHLLEKSFNGLQQEAEQSTHLGHNLALQKWAELILIYTFRLMANTTLVQPSDNTTYSSIFRKYLSLIETDYQKHFPMAHYANLLNITEGQLNKICRAVANLSSKQLVHERLILEAKYQLTYTQLSIKQIAFQLGFQDPAYFTRFFTNHAQLTPKNYRESKPQ